MIIKNNFIINHYYYSKMSESSKKGKQKIEFVFDASMPGSEKSSEVRNFENLKNAILDSMKEGK